MGERAPQHVQNIIIRDYCKRNNFTYLMLDDVVKKLKSTDGIVAYSLFQMPKIKKNRLKIFKEILKKKKEIHFSVENLKICKVDDIENIENIWKIKQTLPNCLNELDQI